MLVDPSDIERIGTTVGNYHLDQILGRGGMGTVYSGEHVYIGKKVAVKVLHPQFAKYEDAVKRFLREARAASSINHPNIVDVTDFGPMPDGGVYFVMESLTGTSLENLIDRKGALPLHRALNVANQMAHALAAAHETGIVHRDLKPDNIMLIRKPGRRDLVRKVKGEGESTLVVEREAEYDFVKILDFGIAKVVGPEQSAPSKTLAGAVFGTPEYMSPEAARGTEVDSRADIYSLGVILFDMLCGRPPFEAQAAADVLAMQIRDDPPSPRTIAPQYEITGQVEDLIFRAMQKQPKDRFQSMDELRDDLQECYGSVGFRRNRQDSQSDQFHGPHSRQKRLTEELTDWMSTDERRLSLEEARAIALEGLAKDDKSS
ncbi:MAG: serine/threonine protein kinase [Myxococcales bacterium]|nr:serine/threonine protein kinase [Myxococcales bacterium]